MESNLWKTLHCPATKTELAVLAIYGEAVSYPYMKAICQCQDKQQNILDLGPLHTHVQEHIDKIINDPNILLGENASYKTASLDGDEWQNSKVVAQILKSIPELPYFRVVLVAFLKGAAETWKCFTSEFAPGGLIDEATLEEKSLAWMPALTHNSMAMFF